MSTGKFFVVANTDQEGLCVVCQQTMQLGEELYAGRCNHPLHRSCAETLVRERRLNQPVEKAEAPCPLCNSLGIFVPELFPFSAADSEEQQRRAALARGEQEASDRAMARDLYFAEFRSVIFLRTRQELEALFRIG